MTTTGKSVAMTLAAAIGLAALAPLPAMAQGGCDWYIKISLKQQSSNLANASCKFQGPQWSANLDVHKSFCTSVRPVVWKKVAQMRKAKLASSGCK